MSYGFKIIAEGDYACFTRPEMKVERVSYDVPTPGALEGLLKSVYWKPAIRYVIDEITVYNPIDFINIRRNEVSDKIPYQAVRSAMSGGGGDPSICTSECRSQRAGMVLKNVRYGIGFHFEMTGLRSGEDDTESKHFNIIKRRLENGQCFRTPCLGCSEFPVKKLYLTDSFDHGEISERIKDAGDVDLGFMCYGLQFRDGGVPENGDWDIRRFSDSASAVFYRPHMINGVIDVSRYREEMKC